MREPYKPCKRCRKRTRNTGGYCDNCQARRDKTVKAQSKTYDRKRGSSASRGYDRQWQKVRGIKLDRCPLCECSRCKAMGRVKAADTVHHIKPVETHHHLRLVDSNLMSMAHQCHEVEEGRRRDYEFEKWQRGYGY
jgi:5-methylcytosine-specific restriction protein A